MPNFIAKYKWGARISNSQQYKEGEIIRFNSIWDIILLKSVVFGEDHLARHGESKRIFEDVPRRFEKQLQNDILVSTTMPTWKSLSE